MDELAGMRVFVKVVETGGLSAAARALGIAPPSVTRRINELEDTLGVRLLNRTTRKLSLTEAGEIYYERTREIVQTVEEANLAVTEKRAAPSGTLRITAASSISRLHLTPAVVAFQMQYPAVRVVMRVTDQILDFVAEGWDVAIRIGQLEDSSLMARKIGECRRVICASPAYLKRAGKLRTPDDLVNHTAITYRQHPGTNLWQFNRGKKAIDVPVTGPLFIDDGESLVAAACSGLGVIVVPEWIIGEDIRNGRLIEVLNGYVPVPSTTPLYALYAPGPYQAPKVKAFIDFLAGRFSRKYVWAERH
ncbi:MAG: LysR family transcriptional regulator [Hyphomicrobiaceae bacterium]